LSSSTKEGDIMGILDNLAGGQSFGSGRSPDVLGAVMGLLNSSGSGGLTGLIQQFAGNGLGDIVNSWVGTGQNMAISPQQIAQGLGGSTLQSLAAKTGLSTDQMSAHLSEILPGIFDRLTPNGQVEQGDIMSQGMDLLKGFLK
jgi:uncharacterized protein YidB (DUF937 family)